MIHPVTNRPADKRSFIPSLVEKEKVGAPPPGAATPPSLPCPDHICLQVSRMVHAIKMGWIQPRRPRDPTPSFYDLWAQEDPNAVLGRHKMHVPAPKLALPGHAESYNPPPEYLPSEEEVGLAQVGFVPGLGPSSPAPLCPQSLAWEQQEPSERKLNFLPRKFPSLRAVPAYSRFIHERFERCLDLYLCPRQRKMRVHRGGIPGSGSGGREGYTVTTCFPASGECGPRRPHPQTASPTGPAAFPHMPGPGEQGVGEHTPGNCPCPRVLTAPSLQVYRGHSDLVRCLSVSPGGQWLVSGGPKVGEPQHGGLGGRAGTEGLSAVSRLR